MIDIVPLHLVDAFWKPLREGMAKACAKGGGQFTPDWLFRICRTGEALLVVVTEGSEVKAGCVVQVQNWSGRMVLNVLAACGRGMRSWLQALHEYGTSQFGVSAIVFEGRPGWKVTPGVKVVRHVYEVDISNVGQ